MAQPITAAPEVAPRDGLAGAVGYGVIVADSDPLDPTGRGWYGPTGYVLESEPCTPAARLVSADWCEEARDWGTASPPQVVGGDQHPFIVQTSIQCSTFGAPNLDVFRAMAVRALERRLWASIASELWSGERSTGEGWSNRHLASPEATILTGAPVSVVEAFALFELMFASCSAGGVQVIHVPRYLTPFLDNAGIIHTSIGSGRLWTANGSLVVADSGYPGTSPDGDPPSPPVMWIYSTGVLTARLGPVSYPERDVADSVSYEDNVIAVHAERPAAIDWACCHLAAEVDVTSDGSGS